MTKRSGPARVPGNAAAGSGVAANVRFAEYSSRGAEGTGPFRETLSEPSRSPRTSLYAGLPAELRLARLLLDGRGTTIPGETMEILAGTSGYSYKEWLGSF